ncbi:hypothetical protein ACFL6C_02835 [Myxococcota bacterium]
MAKSPRKLLKSIRDQLANLEQVVAVGVTPPELTDFLQSIDQQLQEFREESKSRRRQARKRREIGERARRQNEEQQDDVDQTDEVEGQVAEHSRPWQWYLRALVRPLPGSHSSARAPFRVTLWVLTALGALLLIGVDPTPERESTETLSSSDSMRVHLDGLMVDAVLRKTTGDAPIVPPALEQASTASPPEDHATPAVPTAPAKPPVATAPVAVSTDQAAEKGEAAEPGAAPTSASTNKDVGVTSPDFQDEPVASPEGKEVASWVTRYENGARLLNQRKPLLAMAELEQAVELAPAEPKVHLALGVACQRLARQKCAVRAFKKVLELAPTHERAAEIQALLLANTKDKERR